MFTHAIFTILKIIKNTHRHPVNQALHSVGAPFYAAGLALIVGHFAGAYYNHHQNFHMVMSPLAAGASMSLAAIAMFVLGHKIEGNISSMTPVLLFRLVSRKIARDGVAQRFHLLRA